MFLVLLKVLDFRVLLKGMIFWRSLQVTVPRLVDVLGHMSFMRSRGRVIKGKKLPGHMGAEQRVMKNLKVVTN